MPKGVFMGEGQHFAQFTAKEIIQIMQRYVQLVMGIALLITMGSKNGMEESSSSAVDGGTCHVAAPCRRAARNPLKIAVHFCALYADTRRLTDDEHT